MLKLIVSFIVFVLFGNILYYACQYFIGSKTPHAEQDVKIVQKNKNKNANIKNKNNEKKEEENDGKDNSNVKLKKNHSKNNSILKNFFDIEYKKSKNLYQKEKNKNLDDRKKNVNNGKKIDEEEDKTNEEEKKTDDPKDNNGENIKKEKKHINNDFISQDTNIFETQIDY